MVFSCIVVDDDPNTVEVFSDYLEILGIKVIGRGANGNDAIELYKILKPDVVFIDIMMPETDGILAIEMIQMFHKDAKIAAVTADTSDETAEILDKLGISAIIHKPFDPDTIKHVLQDELQIKIEPN